MNDAEILQDKIIDPKSIKITIAETTSRKIDPKLEEEANKEWLSIFKKQILFTKDSLRLYRL